MGRSSCSRSTMHHMALPHEVSHEGRVFRPSSHCVGHRGSGHHFLCHTHCLLCRAWEHRGVGGWVTLAWMGAPHTCSCLDHDSGSAADSCAPHLGRLRDSIFWEDVLPQWIQGLRHFGSARDDLYVLFFRGQFFPRLHVVELLVQQPQCHGEGPERNQGVARQVYPSLRHLFPQFCVSCGHHCCHRTIRVVGETGARMVQIEVFGAYAARQGGSHGTRRNML
mmetsp:Transcript_23800/g.62581  ORF Transcript_23800/g.62581 Transcript_23800/m.62581 type:complete len:222 (+) Transcript_23800:980-1645(+)